MGKQADKTLRNRLRDLAGKAYERELSRELARLGDDFKRWHAGEIDAFDVSDAIHAFHQGAARDLFSRYAPANLEIVVAQAIHNGLVSEDEAGFAVLEYLAGHLEALRKG